MRLGIGTRVLTLALLAAATAAMPAVASGQASVTTAVWTVHGGSARASAPVNLLTLNDQRKIDNRITAYTNSAGRLVLTAPEGLGDPDGSGPYCSLDNARQGDSTATEVSCAPGYIGAIVGDLNGGNDTFNADPGLAVMIGGVIDGQTRPLRGGPGRDRLVGGALTDLIEGGAGADARVGGGGDDMLVGGGGADNLIGGAGNDMLLAGGGPDKLSGGAGRDLCRGDGGADTAKGCEIRRSIP